jgi:site-specific DNA recombinase
MRAAIYVRMSTDKQAPSPERQRNDCVPYATEKGYTIVEIYEDLGMRGTDSTRPDFQRLLKDAASGKFDVVVVSEPSRLSRADDLEFAAKVAFPLREAGVVVESVRDGVLDLSTFVGRLMAGVQQNQANEEVKATSHRAASSISKRMSKRSAVSGTAPFGYDRTKNEAGEWVWTPNVHAETVRLLFAEYLAGRSLKAIRGLLYDRKIKSPRGRDEWTRAAIRLILGSRCYIGEHSFNRLSVGKFNRIKSGRVVKVVQQATSGGNGGASRTIRLTFSSCRMPSRPSSNWPTSSASRPCCETTQAPEAQRKASRPPSSPGCSCAGTVGRF